MRDVSIVGVGQTPVAEHWETSLRHLAFSAIDAALRDAGVNQVDMLLVGNMLAGELSHQEHLGALIADFSGLRGVEAVRVEAADASGGAALRQGFLAVASGLVEVALVVGVEKYTDVVGSGRAAAQATSMDADFEAAQGATVPALAALTMSRYMHEFNLQVADFAGFSVNAHNNGALNPNAMYRNRIKPEGFAKAPSVAAPVSLFDAAPEGDGAAAIVLTSTEQAKDLVPHPIQIAASTAATDALSLHDRADLLTLDAVARSASQAFAQTGFTAADIDFFEAHDSFTIMAALALEACGFAPRGEGWRLATEEGIGLKGKIPLSTFGGLKARGHSGGASGVYQAVEAALQLRGGAGDNQVDGAQIGMIQSIGGLGGTAVTHILETIE